MALYYWKENRDVILGQATGCPRMLPGLRSYMNGSKEHCICHGSESDIFTSLLTKLSGTILPQPRPPHVLEWRVVGLVCTCSEKHAIARSVAEGEGDASSTGEGDGEEQRQQEKEEKEGGGPASPEVKQEGPTPDECYQYYCSFHDNSNIPEDQRLLIFDRRIVTVVTHLMNVLNHEVALTKLHGAAAAAAATGAAATGGGSHDLSSTLQLSRAHREICHYINRYFLHRDVRAAELLYLLRMYVMKPYTGYCVVPWDCGEQQEDAGTPEDTGKGLMELKNQLEVEFACFIHIQANLDRSKYIVCVQSACVADYLDIKQRLKGEDMATEH